LRTAHKAEQSRALAEIKNDASQERSVARALITARFQAKIADAKRNTPRHELAARIAALRTEYFAMLVAVSMQISQRARERRRAAMNLIVARQKQERLAVSFRAAGKEVGSRQPSPESNRPGQQQRHRQPLPNPS
jgi:hypothetical protein